MRIGEAALGSPDTGYILIPILQGDLRLDRHRNLIHTGEWTIGWNHNNQSVVTKDDPIHMGIPVIYIYIYIYRRA